MGQYLLKAPNEDLDRWKKTAKAHGLSLAEWMRRRLNSTPLDPWRDLGEAGLPTRPHVGLPSKRSYRPDPK